MTNVKQFRDCHHKKLALIVSVFTFCFSDIIENKSLIYAYIQFLPTKDLDSKSFN